MQDPHSHSAVTDQNSIPVQYLARQLGEADPKVKLNVDLQQRSEPPLWAAVKGAAGERGAAPPVQVHILKADKAGEWWKFTVNIISVYKQGESRIRRGDQFLWVRAKDVACKCPKIKPGKKYLLLGNDEDSPGQGGVVADKGSLVIQWRDTWARRLRKFQQREKKGKCKKP
ncbi:Netrin-1 [Liparis tanakae]|uniref:Netrin-1 n=1 Tax=Liparis tanakae TaxID=230148 RepID=A0A4Z2GQ81_9TELE|nr:Netrin-1 [Liparis tanakae]